MLALSAVLEAFSLRTGIGEANQVRGDRNWGTFIRRSKAPELPVVLLEDVAALIGLAFAFTGVALSVLTGDGRWDGAGSLAIGVLLATAAAILAVEMKSLLIGESASPDMQRMIIAALEDGPELVRVIHLRTVHMSPDAVLVAAKIAVRESDTAAQITAGIDAAERRVRAAVPIATTIYLEPDIYRPQQPDRHRPLHPRRPAQPLIPPRPPQKPQPPRRPRPGKGRRHPARKRPQAPARKRAQANPSPGVTSESCRVGTTAVTSSSVSVMPAGTAAGHRTFLIARLSLHTPRRAASTNIREDWGSAESFVHDRPPGPPGSPKTPWKIGNPLSESNPGQGATAQPRDSRRRARSFSKSRARPGVAGMRPSRRPRSATAARTGGSASTRRPNASDAGLMS